MAIAQGNKVEFVYLKSGKKYPDNVGIVKYNVVYFEEDTQRIYVNDVAFGGSDEDIAAFLNAWGISFTAGPGQDPIASGMLDLLPNVTIAGDLEVMGTTTVTDIEVEELHVEDNFIVLNKNTNMNKTLSGIEVLYSSEDPFGIVVHQPNSGSPGLFIGKLEDKDSLGGTGNLLFQVPTRDPIMNPYGTLYWNQNGRISSLAPGTEGYFYRSTGTGTPPGWGSVDFTDLQSIINNSGTKFLKITNAGTSLETAAAFRASIGAGTGSVTSVGLSLPNIFNVTVSPITTTGELTATLANQAPNKVFAGPTGGMNAIPTFRDLVAADLPAAYGDSKNPYASKTKNYVLAAPGNTNGVPSFRALTVDDISDVATTYLKLNGDNYMTGALSFDEDRHNRIETDNADLKLSAFGYIVLNSTVDIQGLLGMNNNKIIGVADGTNANDAVNYSQLQAAENAASTTYLKLNGDNYMTGALNFDIYGHNRIETDNGHLNLSSIGYIKLNSTVGIQGLLAMENNRITGVADGINAKDAVNYSQLQAAENAASTTWDVI